MEEPFENLYFNWLCAKVAIGNINTPSENFKKLLKLMHSMEFIWLISGDDNRAADGYELRENFIFESNIIPPEDFFMFGCSIFEMLVAFAKRAAFMTSDTSRYWFRIFIDNLRLSDMYDANFDHDYCLDILNCFVWRLYDEKGDGGIFPMRNPKSNQKKLEVWYQFCEYLMDIDYPI